jgi:hypothetical protein
LIKLVLSKFNGNKFRLNQLLNCSNTALILNWKSTIFELVVTALVSSVKIISIAFQIKSLGKLLIYVRNNKGLRIDELQGIF